MEESLAVRNLIPRRVVEVMDQSFRIYRDNFVTFIGLVAVVIVPLTALSFFLSESIEEDVIFLEQDAFGNSTFQSNFEGTGLLLLMVRLVTLFIQFVVLNAVITYIASENYLGRSATIPEAISAMLRRVLHLTLATIMNVVVFAVTGGILGVAAVCILPALLFPMWVYYLFAAFTFLVPTIVLEDVGFIDGTLRGIVLAKTRFWRVLGFWIGMLGIVYVMQINFSIISWLIVGSTYSFDEIFFSSNTGANALSTALGTVASVLVTPIMPIALTLLYYDTRFREEGLDVALLSIESESPSPRNVYSEKLGGELFKRRDFLNMFILTIGTIGFCGGIYALIFILAAVLA